MSSNFSKNMGRMNDPDGSAYIKGLCGDSMEMYLMVKEGLVTEAKFFTDGCSASMTCGSIGASLAEGNSLKDILRLSPMNIVDNWGDIPQGNIHCAILAINTLHKAVADYLLKDSISLSLNPNIFS